MDGQISPDVRQQIPWMGDTLVLDSMAVFPGSLVIVYRGDTLDSDSSFFMPLHGRLWINSSIRIGDTLDISYRRLPWRAGLTVSHKQVDLIRSHTDQTIRPYAIGDSRELSFTEDQGIQKNGSVSRGVLFGNNQNLSVNSTLNLQLSGKITEEIRVLASITDDNIPIQPAGNTQQLQDFDQVFIQLYNDNTKLVAGDFQLRRPTGYFMNYFKRAQGAYLLSASGDSLKGRFLSVETSASISKGRFARNVIQAVEGNQGPYRLTGADNELFIIVLSGTEMVYIDGRLLERGMDKDYVIDYNAAEITFTPRQLMTKDRRITVEFQYSERRYARPLLQSSIQWKKPGMAAFVNVYSEGDAKNQPLQQELSAEDKQILSAGGDDFLSAYRNGIDSLGFSNNEVCYAMIDTLGADSVFIFSTDSTVAHYRVNFSYVGRGNGDYVEAGFSANGKIYQWVQPVFNGSDYIKQGSYAPIILLASPKTNRMISAGYRTMPGGKQNIIWETEGAVSHQDLNTFSTRDAGDDFGWAARSTLRWNEKQPIAMQDTAIVKEDSIIRTSWSGRLGYEFTHRFFKPIERFREVEFQRNWNLGTTPWIADQHWVSASTTAGNRRWGKITAGTDALWMPDAYIGFKPRLQTDIRTVSKWVAQIDASALITQGDIQSSFIRHRGRLSKDIGKVRFLFIDEHERNLFRAADTVQNNSYAFYDWEFSVGTVDTLKRSLRVFYRDRIDQRLDGSFLSGAARADHYGAQLLLSGTRDSRLTLQVSNRRLRVIDPELFTQSPENTLVGRMEYNAKWWKGFIQNTTFYEVGSGLEQRREFIYLEVPAGQGTYVWNDYNNNQIKELNEFEVAAFSYEANYIRSFVQSNDYVKTYSNQFSESLIIQPARIVKGQGKTAKFVSRWSSNSTFRIERKTSREDEWQRFNPFNDGLSDTVLLSTNGLLRNIIFFNKAHPKFGMDYTRQLNRTRNLLSNGFESRMDRLEQLGIRWNFIDAFTIYSELRWGNKGAASDFLIGRNYAIQYRQLQPKMTYQPSPSMRLGTSWQYAEKQNTLSTEQAVVRKLTAECALNALEKGSLRAELNFYSISYDAPANNPLAFEMLEGLQPGYNLTWAIGVQKTITGNIQFNVQYNGRKPRDQTAIHAGSMQVRAVF